jgi:hypothetical protein
MNQAPEIRKSPGKRTSIWQIKHWLLDENLTLCPDNNNCGCAHPKALHACKANPGLLLKI